MRIFVVVAALLGCGSSNSGQGSLDAGDPLLLVGTGANAFEWVTEDTIVPLIEGSQGGYHIWISVRAKAVGPRVIVHYGVQDAKTDEGLSAENLRIPVDLRQNGEWLEWTGLVGFLQENDPAIYVGRRVSLWALIEEESGFEIRGEVDAVAGPPL